MHLTLIESSEKKIFERKPKRLVHRNAILNVLMILFQELRKKRENEALEQATGSSSGLIGTLLSAPFKAAGKFLDSVGETIKKI